LTRRGRRRWRRRSGTRKLRSLGCLTRGKLRLGPPSSSCRLACLFGRDQLSKVTVDSRQRVALNGHGTLDVCPIALQRTGRGARGRLCARVPLTSPGQVVARGTVSGVATTTANGVASVLQNVAVPVAVGQATCSILHLDLGPLSLNVLGLQIDLSRVVLDITAQSGAGNLLGNLLCSVAGLLDNPGGLANVLNNLLGALLG